jgi:hypothetical protein
MSWDTLPFDTQYAILKDITLMDEHPLHRDGQPNSDHTLRGDNILLNFRGKVGGAGGRHEDKIGDEEGTPDQKNGSSNTYHGKNVGEEEDDQSCEACKSVRRGFLVSSESGYNRGDGSVDISGSC